MGGGSAAITCRSSTSSSTACGRHSVGAATTPCFMGAEPASSPLLGGAVNPSAAPRRGPGPRAGPLATAPPGRSCDPARRGRRGVRTSCPLTGTTRISRACANVAGTRPSRSTSSTARRSRAALPGSPGPDPPPSGANSRWAHPGTISCDAARTPASRPAVRGPVRIPEPCSPPPEVTPSRQLVPARHRGVPTGLAGGGPPRTLGKADCYAKVPAVAVRSALCRCLGLCRCGRGTAGLRRFRHP